MAFEPINSTEIQVGKPITAQLMLKIKNSLDDLDVRLEGAVVVEVSSTNTVDMTAATNMQLGDTSGGAFTSTLPDATLYEGKNGVFLKTSSDAYAWTIDGYDAQTINGSANYQITGQYDAVTIISDGSNWLIRDAIKDSITVFTTRSINTTAPITGGGNLSSDRTLALNPLVNADVSGSAALAYSKLNLATSIVNADISGSAAIAYSKLSLGNSIVNADINSSAAIAFSKLAALTASRAVVTDGGGFITTSSVTSTELGYLSGVTSAIQTQFSGFMPRYNDELEDVLTHVAWNTTQTALQDFQTDSATNGNMVLVTVKVDATADSIATYLLLLSQPGDVEVVKFSGDTTYFGAGGVDLSWQLTSGVLEYLWIPASPAGFVDVRFYIRSFSTTTAF